MSKNLYVSFMRFNDNCTKLVKENLIDYFNYKNCKIIDFPTVNDTNSIYFIVKFWKWIKIIKNNEIAMTKPGRKLLPKINEVRENNTFIFQIVDAYCTLDELNYKIILNDTFKYFDHIVFNSIFHSMMFFDWKFYIKNYHDLAHLKTEDKAIDHYKNFGIYENRKIFEKSHSVIYHEYDIRLKPTYKILNEVIYLGNLEKTSLSEDDFKKFNIILGDVSMTNSCIHIDFLNDSHMYYKLHTSTKLSTAMYFNCIFVCNRIPVYVELLGESYEFYINDDKSNLENLINNAKEILLDKQKYKNYLNSVSHVRQKLSPEDIGKQHKILFDMFN